MMDFIYVCESHLAYAMQELPRPLGSIHGGCGNPATISVIIIIIAHMSHLVCRLAMALWVVWAGPVLSCLYVCM
jgi:hypothetical protein